MAAAQVQIGLRFADWGSPANERVCWVELRATDSAAKIIGVPPADTQSTHLPLVHHTPMGLAERVRQTAVA